MTHAADEKPPNILFIFTDDHALNAISAYGGPLAKVAPTPHLDRIAKEGMLFRHCLVSNSICAPSRAVVLTGKYSHLNGQLTNKDMFDGSQQTVSKLLKKPATKPPSLVNGTLNPHLLDLIISRCLKVRVSTTTRYCSPTEKT